MRHQNRRRKENLTETPKTETPSAEAKASTAEFNLTQRIEAVIKDALESKLKAMEANIDAKIEAILKAKEVEVEQALRKGLGVESDPVIHQSDLISAIRKASLETAETAKKTPAATEKAGPEGNKPTNQIDAIYDTYGGKA